MMLPSALLIGLELITMVPQTVSIRFVLPGFAIRSASVSVVSVASLANRTWGSVQLGSGERRPIAGRAAVTVGSVPLADGLMKTEVSPDIASFAAVFAEVEVERRTDNRRFSLAFLPPPTFRIGAEDIARGSTEIGMDAAQLVRLQAAPSSTTILLLTETQTIEIRADRDGGAWLLLAPGSYFSRDPTTGRERGFIVSASVTSEEQIIDLSKH